MAIPFFQSTDHKAKKCENNELFPSISHKKINYCHIPLQDSLSKPSNITASKHTAGYPVEYLTLHNKASPFTFFFSVIQTYSISQGCTVPKYLSVWNMLPWISDRFIYYFYTRDILASALVSQEGTWQRKREYFCPSRFDTFFFTSLPSLGSH